MSSVNSKNNSPMDALRGLMGSVVGEGNRAVGELRQHSLDDIASIGKSIESGGFLGGIVQALDVFSLGNMVSNVADAATGPGQLPPQIKEMISGAVNIASGNPIWLKDLFDLATSPAQPGVPPSAPNSVPPPDVDQLRGGGPHAPGDSDRSGYTDSPAPPRSRTDIHVCTEQAAMPMQELLAAMEYLRDSPECAARFPGIHAALNDDNMSMAEQNTVIIATVLREHPEVLDALGDIEGAKEARATIPRGEIPAAPETPPSTSTESNAGPQLQGLLGGALGFIGGLLSNPMVQGLLVPVLTGLLAAIPPLQVLIPFLPVILPIAGQLLSGVGGALSSSAGGAGGAPGGAPGGLGGDAFGGMLNSLVGGFGGALGLPSGAAPLIA